MRYLYGFAIAMGKCVRSSMKFLSKIPLYQSNSTFYGDYVEKKFSFFNSSFIYFPIQPILDRGNSWWFHCLLIIDSSQLNKSRIRFIQSASATVPIATDGQSIWMTAKEGGRAYDLCGPRSDMADTRTGSFNISVLKY